jgi:energy-coupling factor transporter ATP-binding protein EcfA2
MSFKLDKLTVRHLTGARAPLHALDLDIAQGEQLALIGPSGAGKTTLLSTLACAHQPAAGSFTCSASRSLGADRMRRATPCARACSWRRRRRRCRRASASSPPCWRRACRTGAWEGALRSLFRPADPDAAFEALVPLRPRRQTVCARRPPLGRRTPALQPGAPAGLERRRLPRRRADFRARPGPGPHHAGHAAGRSRQPQGHPGVQPAPGRDGARAFRPHRRPARAAASCSTCRANASPTP